MKIWQDLISNQALVSGVIAWFIAQFLKAVIEIGYYKEYSVHRLWGSGGMPSSHSATVCGLTVACGLIYGLSSFEFAISFLFACVVMYDAMGVRRETGKQAKLLNLIMETDFFHIEEIQDFDKKFKELVGHTPLQVWAGAILGIITAVTVNLFY